MFHAYPSIQKILLLYILIFSGWLIPPDFEILEPGTNKKKIKKKTLKPLASHNLQRALKILLLE